MGIAAAASVAYVNFYIYKASENVIDSEKQAYEY